MYTIMTVEDEPIEREALHRILTNEYQNKIKFIIEAKNGAEAIAKARHFKPDIILMDIGLPEVNGIDAQSQIISFLPNVQTIIISAYSHFSYAQKALQYNVRDYLLKPVKTMCLTNAIDKIMIDLNKTLTEEYPLNIKQACSDIVKEATSYMHINFKGKIDLQSISNQVHLNPQYFSRVFKKEMGISCVDYLNSLRVDYACKLLTSTSYPGYRVAMESGFTDPSYFSRIFTKYKKNTPTEYRKKHSKITMNNN